MPRFSCYLLLMLLTAAVPLLAQVPPPPPPPVDHSEYFGRIMETMPLFPGYDTSLAHPSERKRQADSLLLTFIYGNLEYDNIEGELKKPAMAVVSFIVEADGRVADPWIVRDPGQGMGEEARRVVCLMQEYHHWTPGTQAGKNVRVQFNLPVKFSPQ